MIDPRCFSRAPAIRDRRVWSVTYRGSGRRFWAESRRPVGGEVYFSASYSTEVALRLADSRGDLVWLPRAVFPDGYTAGLVPLPSHLVE